MSYGRVTPDQLRELARLVETGRAYGDLRVDVERDFDFKRYSLEFVVAVDQDPYRRRMEQEARRMEQEAIRMMAMEIEPGIFVKEFIPTFPPPIDPGPSMNLGVNIVTPTPLPIDPGPSMNLWVNIVKVIIRAWASDVVTDNMVRYSLLELQ